jgi:hypothetical protein
MTSEGVDFKGYLWDTINNMRYIAIYNVEVKNTSTSRVLGTTDFYGLHG